MEDEDFTAQRARVDAQLEGLYSQRRITSGKWSTWLPTTISDLRDRPLAACVNPLMFRRGRYGDWFAFGNDRSRGAGTANILSLKPAPLGIFITPRFHGDPPAAIRNDQPGDPVSLDEFARRLLPTALTQLLVPHKILPVQVASLTYDPDADKINHDRGKDGKKRLYQCTFPRCEAPANMSGVSTKREKVVMHLLVDHLGLIPTCHHCGKSFLDIGKARQHEGKCPREHNSLRLYLYGYTIAADWERWGKSDAEMGEEAATLRSWASHAKTSFEREVARCMQIELDDYAMAGQPGDLPAEEERAENQVDADEESPRDNMEPDGDDDEL